MVRKVYDAQKLNTTAGDFCELVEEDKILIGLHMTDTHIANTSKAQFKTILKQKIREASFNYLINLKRGHSKMSNIAYEKYVMYLVFSGIHR